MPLGFPYEYHPVSIGRFHHPKCLRVGMKQIVGLVSISLRDDRNVVSKISRREHAN